MTAAGLFLNGLSVYELSVYELSAYELCGVLLAVVASAWLITALTLKLALARQVLDIPNDRSSHLVPTPKGGGVGIVLATSVALFWLAARVGHPVFFPVTIMTTCGLSIAAIGFADDLKPLSARLRFGIQLLAATVFLVCLNPPSGLSVAGLPVPAMVALFLALGWMLWMTNLYNFMDGIDGLAGIHTMAVGICAALILATAQAPLALWFAALLLAAASGGFMVWNFPPARIFMGDTGSAWLGFIVAALALLSGIHNPQLFWVWIILPGVFVADASITLLSRLLHGQKIYEAHRSHVYQRVSLRLMIHYQDSGLDTVVARSRAHRLYCLFSLAVMALWLLPLAWLVSARLLDGFTATLIAYTPLVLVALWAKAGKPD